MTLTDRANRRIGELEAIDHKKPCRFHWIDESDNTEGIAGQFSYLFHGNKHKLTVYASDCPSISAAEWIQNRKTEMSEQVAR